ncbi:MAG: helix-turn-helix transcriptional regulator [Bacteroidia bacterium]
MINRREKNLFNMRYVIVLEGESPENKFYCEVLPHRPGIGLQIEELISVEREVNDDLVLSGMDFYLKEIIQVKDEDFEVEKKRLQLALKHKAKPIEKPELTAEEKLILIMAAQELPTKEIADKLKIKDEALRKRKERLLARLQIKGLVMLKAWLKKRGIV